MERPSPELIATWQARLNDRLSYWQDAPNLAAAAVNMANEINYLKSNRIGFTLKVDKAVLEKTGFRSVSISKDDAESYGKVEGENLVFEILDKDVNRVLGQKFLTLAVIGSQETVYIALVGSIGTFAKFLPGEVTSIALK